jgi:hypothetical protein
LQRRKFVSFGGEDQKESGGKAMGPQLRNIRGRSSRRIERKNPDSFST